MSRLSNELLAQAGMLARREPRKPRQASLRRSISASYYSVFHFLIEECTRIAVGTAHDRARFRQFAGRAFVHGKMKSVCEEFTKNLPKSELLKPFWSMYQVSTNMQIKTIAQNFIDLQEQRHSADYDLSWYFTRDEATTSIDKAQEIMDAWGVLKAQHAELSLLFALSLMLWPGLIGR
jgi:uncharacterized protein (UPF0332 family)